MIQDLGLMNRTSNATLFRIRIFVFVFAGVFLVGLVVLVTGKFAEYQIATSEKFLQQAREEFEKPEALQDKQILSAAFQEALAYAKRASVLRPTLAAAWLQLGTVYKDMEGVPGSTEWGVKSFERAKKLEPSRADTLTDLGIMYKRQGQEEKAQKELEQAILLNPRHKEARKELSFLLEETGENDRAYSLMRETALIFPEDGKTLFQLGRIEYNRGHTAQAIELFERVLAISSADSNARYALAVALAKEGKEEEALKHFEQVLLLNPDNQDVIRNIEKLQQ